nr:fatty acid synthase-like [Leptinotarsa decemlineata]
MNVVPDDAVISGIAGYFPKSKNLVEFKKRLYENKSLLTPVFSDSNLNVTPYLGDIDSEYFDHSYFGIHKLQCTYMDPMHRLALERTLEAIMDAGFNPHEIKGKRIGVFMGSTIGENDNLFMESVVSGFGVTGHSRAMLPNRISYWLNLKGPSVAYDTNWINGMEILRLAFAAIKTGQCDSVIVGTTNVCCQEELQWLYDDMGLLSKDGSIKAFDANACGYGRSEGVVVMFIQRSSEARRIYGSIMHISTRFDGNHKGNLMNFEEENMTEFLEEFYQNCSVKPEEIDYVETHGCAIKLMDKAELNSLERVFCPNRKKPLLLTSVKTITGHSEASSSLFSIVQALLAMEEEVIPATLQYETPNPDIPGLTNGNLQVVTKNTEWSSDYVAVNSLGLDSCFGHVVFKRNPKKKVHRKLDLPMLLLVSTRTETGIKEIIETLKTKPEDPEYYKLIHDIFSKPIQGYLQRGYLLRGEGEPKQETAFYQGNKRPIWFVYSGMGSQWCGMLGDFMKIEVFANSIKKSHDTLAVKGLDLINIITTSDKTIFDSILHCFVGIAAIQIALTDVMRSLGIVPDGIIGHSVGELGCAYADGCMTAEQMILASYYRGMASIEATLITGMMAAIGLGYDQIKDRLPPNIEVACHNSSQSCTLSGPTEDMEKFVEQLQDEGVFARLVNVANIAYHSRYIKPAGPLLLKYLKVVLPSPVARSSKWISTSNPETNWNTHLAKNSSAEYHTNNLLSSVLFEEGCKHIPEDAVLIEIAPHGLLQAILKRSMKSAINIPLTQRKTESSVEFLLQNLGKLYLAGVEMNLSNLYPKVEYPVSRNTCSLTDLVHWDHADRWIKAKDTSQSSYGIQNIMITLTSEQFRDCVGHQLDERFILPVSSYLELLFQCTDNVPGGRTEVVFENLHFRKPLVIPKNGCVPLNALVQPGSGEFTVYSNKDLLLTGKMLFPIPGEEFELDKAEVELIPDAVQLSKSDFYNEMQHRGHKYSGMFKTLKNLTMSEDGTVSHVEWNNKWTYLLEAMLQQQLFLTGERNQEIHVPRFIRKIALSLPFLPIQTTDTEITFEYATSIISTDGIEVTGMITAPLDIEDRIYFDGMECVPLNGTFEKIEAAIDFAIQLAGTDEIGQEERNLYLTELETDDFLSSAMKNVSSASKVIKVHFSTVEEVSRIILHPAYPQLFAVNGPASEEMLRLTISSGAFLLTKAEKSLLSHPNLFPVAQFRVGPHEYVILRKIVKENSRIVSVKGDTLSAKDLKRSSASWTSELHAALEEAAPTQNKVCLITTLVPVEGFHNFVRELKSLPNTRSLQVIFNLDKKPFDIKFALQRDLTLKILKAGAWYTYLPFCTQYKNDIELNNTSISSMIENLNINYLSVNLKDDTLNPATQKRNEVGNIDYSGITKNGDRVMGLGRLDKDTSKLVLDPVLTWPIPKKWTLEDGATVPHAFASAYYMLMTVAKLKPGNTVFIHAGCSPIGLAASSIATLYGCNVYVSVSNDTQRAYLQKNFLFINESNILNSDDCSFKSKLMEVTSGKGADVILNCVSGPLLRSSLDCIANFGRFVHYGKYDTEEGNTIGMYCFLRNPSFYVVDLNNICSLPREVKKEIRELVENGIENFTVRPLVRQVMTRNDVDNMLSKMKSSGHIGKIVLKISDNFSVNKLNVKKPNTFICNAKQSYLVYGGSAEICADVIEWLVLHGAKRIVVSADIKPTQNYISRRLSLLQTHFGVDIITASAKASTKEGAAELLSEVYSIGPLHLVFTLPNKTTGTRISDTKPVQYLDSALRTTAPKATVINFINSAAGICFSRAEAGFSTFNIQWQESLDMKDGISVLDAVLNSRVDNVLVKKRLDIDDVTIQGAIKDLGNVIPSIEEIIREQKNAKQEPEWVQIVSEGPLEIRELAPLFIIPGLTGHKELEKMIERLLLPTFVAVAPATSWPLDKMAEVYAKKMRSIYPKGVFNIVSVSSGGFLAIEIAKILTKQKASIHLFFIDSAPRKVQQALERLGEDRSDQALNVLKMVFAMKDSEVVRKLEATSDWNSRIKICLEGYEGTKQQRHLLEAGLLRLENQLDTIATYRPNGVLVSGTVHLLAPNEASQNDYCGLESCCQSQPRVTLVPGDHLSIIRHNDTSDYINMNHWLI